MRQTQAALLFAAIALTASAAQAAPYVTEYQGIVSNSDVPGVNNGSPYVVSVVFDNGSSTGLNQSWGAAHITCVMWRMAGGAVAYAQPQGTLAGDPIIYSSDNAVTDGTGVLTQMFSSIITPVGVPPGSYTATSPIAGTVGWVAYNANPVFGYVIVSVEQSFDDAAGGVRMQPQFWTPPQPFTGTCAATSGPGHPSTPAAIPTLGHGALALLGACVGALGLWRRRREA